MRLQISESAAHRRIRILVDTHGMALIRFAQQFTGGHHHTTEDIVQDTLIRAWRHLDRVPSDEDGQRRWLFTVAHRLAIDYARRQRMRPTDRSEMAEDHLATTGDETSMTVVAIDSLRFGLESLAPIHRQIIDELYLRNRSAEEVAEYLQIPVGTVRSRAYYAMQNLRAAMTAA